MSCLSLNTVKLAVIQLNLFQENQLIQIPDLEELAFVVQWLKPLPEILGSHIWALFCCLPVHLGRQQTITHVTWAPAVCMKDPGWKSWLHLGPDLGEWTIRWKVSVSTPQVFLLNSYFWDKWYLLVVCVLFTHTNTPPHTHTILTYT